MSEKCQTSTYAGYAVLLTAEMSILHVLCLSKASAALFTLPTLASIASISVFWCVFKHGQ